MKAKIGMVRPSEIGLGLGLLNRPKLTVVSTISIFCISYLLFPVISNLVVV